MSMGNVGIPVRRYGDCPTLDGKICTTDASSERRPAGPISPGIDQRTLCIISARNANNFCNFPLPTEMLEIKSNKFCKKIKCNKSMLRYFNISVS